MTSYYCLLATSVYYYRTSIKLYFFTIINYLSANLKIEAKGQYFSWAIPHVVKEAGC